MVRLAAAHAVPASVLAKRAIDLVVASGVHTVANTADGRLNGSRGQAGVSFTGVFASFRDLIPPSLVGDVASAAISVLARGLSPAVVDHEFGFDRAGTSVKAYPGFNAGARPCRG